MNIQMQGIRRTIAMTGMLAGLLLGAGSVLAQAEGAPPPKPSPEARQKFEERCKADPQKCEEWKKNHPPRPDGPRPDGQPMEPPPPPRASN